MPGPAAGVLFGPYQLIDKIGAGGMGEVWKALDARINRIVAIKVSHLRFSDHFAREATAIAALNHPNICSLYDIGPDYLVMEHIDGEPIRPVRTLPELIALAAQLADGLASAHAAGIIHRDLKPDNVLITHDGRLKILDFGIAQHDGHRPGESAETQTVALTQPGTVVGTVAYMSPEQARGLQVDRRTDQFSFGLILYELASGRHPFLRETAAQTTTAIIEADADPLPPVVPAPFRWIIQRCLAKDPARRYESTRDLYEDLRLLRDHVSEVTTAVLNTTGARPKHNRMVLALLGAMTLAVAGGIFYAGRQARDRGTSFVPVHLTSSGGIAQSPSFSPDGSQVVFSWNGPRENNFNLYVKSIEGNDLLRLTTNAVNDKSPAWSPDGRTIAFVRSFADMTSAVMLISPFGGSERKLIEISRDRAGSWHSRLAWTPDARFLAVSDSTSTPATGQPLYLVSLDTAQRKPLTQPFEEKTSAFSQDLDPAFSPDGHGIAFIRLTGALSARMMWMPLDVGFDPAGPTTRLPTPAPLSASPVWTSNRELVFSSGLPGTMRLYHVGLGAASVANAIKDTLTAGNVAISRNGARLIYSSAERIHNLVQLALDGSGTPTGAPARLTSTTGGDFAPKYSPDGKSILYGSRRFNEVGLWMTDIAAEHSSELTSSRQAIIAPGTWAPDGKSILFHDTSDHGVWQVYRMALDTRRITRLTFETGNSAIPRYSRDGNWIYFSSVHAGAFVLKRMAASGGPSTVIVGRSVAGAQESADGRWLYFSDWPSGGLWKMPMGGGEISRVLESIIEYALTPDAVYYWSGEARHLMLRRLDLKSGTDKVIFRPLRPAAPGLTATPDGHRLCYPEIQHDSQELLMLENWR